MRVTVALVAAALVAATAQQASASEVRSIETTPSGTASISGDGAVAVSGAAAFSDPVKTLVFEDKQGDDALLAEATPPWQDLKAGYITVNRPSGSLDLTWQVYALPPVLGGIPDTLRYMWEFSLTPPGGGAGDAVLFQAQAKFTNLTDRSFATDGDGNGPQLNVGAGKLSGNCTTANNLVTCVRIGVTPVTFDVQTNQVTIHIPFSLLKTRAGAPLVVDGALYRSVVIFKGIVAINQAVASSGAMGDSADVAPAPFLLGRHVRLGINPTGSDDADLVLDQMAAAYEDGSFTGSVPLTGLLPGSYEVDARACRDALCGELYRSAPIELTE